jgi:hypothetical protein
MRLLVTFLALFLAAVVNANGQHDCHADNCARAVTGTRPGKKPDVTSRIADCSSFMLTTVTPEPKIS